MNYVHLTNDVLLGACEWKGKMDLLNIFLIGLSKELPEHNLPYELHRLLGTLLSKKLSSDEKLNIMEMEYDIPIVDEIRKDVGIMCNLSQGIREETREEIIINMHNTGFSIKQIALATQKDEEEVKAILEKSSPVLV